MEERWKVIEGYPDYEVSDLGRIKSHRTRIIKILKPMKQSRGYVDVQLSNEYGKRRFTIHRLVLKAFTTNNGIGLQCNHLNCDKKDNRLSNLEWVTPQQNSDHAIKNGLRGDYISIEKVIEIKKLLAEGNLNNTEIAKTCGVARPYVSFIKTKRIRKAINMYDLSNYAETAGKSTYSTITPGTYTVILDNAEIKTTKAGNGEYVAAKFKVMNGEFEGRTIFQNFTWTSQNPKAVEIGRNHLTSFVQSSGGSLKFSSILDLVGLRCDARVINKTDDYGTKAEIATFERQTQTDLPF